MGHRKLVGGACGNLRAFWWAVVGVAINQEAWTGGLSAKTFFWGRAEVRWSSVALVLVICRLCKPSSELYIAEHFYRETALPQLLGVPVVKVNTMRLYRALDQLLPHKEELEVFFKNRLRELFDLGYGLLLYDVTSTYFEGQTQGNPKAQFDYSRDKRRDCKQVCITLVFFRCGMPLGYEVFDGNCHDSTTVETIVTTMEFRYGKANRVWVMDRGTFSKANIKFLQEGVGVTSAAFPRACQNNLRVNCSTSHGTMCAKVWKSNSANRRRATKRRLFFATAAIV